MFGYNRNRYDSPYDNGYNNGMYRNNFNGYRGYDRYNNMGVGVMNPVQQQQMMMAMMQKGAKNVDPEVIKQMQLMNPQMLQQLADADPKAYRKFMKRMYTPSIFKRLGGVAKSLMARLDDKDDYDEQEPAYSKKVLAQAQTNPQTGEDLPSPQGKNRQQYRTNRLAELAKRKLEENMYKEDDGSVSAKTMNNRAGRNLLKEKMALKIKEKSDSILSAANAGLSKAVTKASDVVANAGEGSIITDVLGEKGKKIISSAGQKLAESMNESREKVKVDNVTGFGSIEDLETDPIELQVKDQMDISQLESYVLYSMEITGPTILDFTKGKVYTNRLISGVELKQERKVKFLETDTVTGERVSISCGKAKVKSTGEIREILRCSALEGNHIYPATMMISLENDVDKRFGKRMREINCEMLYIGIPKGSYAILRLSLRKPSNKLGSASDVIIAPEEPETDDSRLADEQY